MNDEFIKNANVEFYHKSVAEILKEASESIADTTSEAYTNRRIRSLKQLIKHEKNYLIKKKYQQELEELIKNGKGC